MMSSVFWEMWNENHGEIDEKVWENQKKQKNKIKDEIRVCDSYLINAEKPRSYLIGAVRLRT